MRSRVKTEIVGCVKRQLTSRTQHLDDLLAGVSFDWQLAQRYPGFWLILPRHCSQIQVLATDEAGTVSVDTGSRVRREFCTSTYEHVFMSTNGYEVKLRT
jgi:hypothetical protein